MDNKSKLQPSTALLLLAIAIAFVKLLIDLTFLAGAAAGRVYYGNRRQIDAAARFAGKVTVISARLGFVLALHASHWARLWVEDFVHTQLGDYARPRGRFTAYAVDLPTIGGTVVATSATTSAVKATVTVSESAAPVADSKVTAEDLRAQYGSFRAAKEALGLKARSWAELAAKVAQ